MKSARFMKWIRFAVILCFTMSVCLSGCRSVGTEDFDSFGSEPTVSIISEESGSLLSKPDLDSSAYQDTSSGLISTGKEPEGLQLAIYGTGKVRIRYTGNVSSVTYITSAADLPDNEALKKYDEAYFQDKALLLITESVPSGSIEVNIASIDWDGAVATVTLYHGAPENGTYATNDMATWLIWAEVDTGLDCRWIVANPALNPETAAY